VLEVGLGGRWDATSVVNPSVAVITGVGLDHTAVLGDTLEAIAAEKAAIIRPASAPVLGPGTDGLDSIFLRAADMVSTHPRAVREGLEFSPVPEELTVRFRVVERPSSPDGYLLVSVDGVHAQYPALALSGPAYQAANVATAVAAAEAALGRALHVESSRAALRAVGLPGRFELARSTPPVIVDGSHNPQAAEALAHAIRDAFPDPVARPLLLLGILADKDARGIVEALAPIAEAFAVTQPDSPRAMPAETLAALVSEVTGTAPQAVFASVAEAIGTLAAGSCRGIVVTGSITTAGEARAALRNT
jgi:dihydrofolate synthase / folylpolyglutamate synthase